MEELKKQKLLAELLNDKFCEYNLKSKAYAGNDFKRVDGHWANKPDLIIVDAPKIMHPILNEPHILKPIIGIEFKDNINTGTILSGMEQVQQYKDYSYRDLEQKLGIPKSKIHYLIKYSKRKKIKDGNKIIYLK